MRQGNTGRGPISRSGRCTLNQHVLAVDAGGKSAAHGQRVLWRKYSITAGLWWTENVTHDQRQMTEAARVE